MLGDSLVDAGNAHRAVDRFDDLLPGDLVDNPAPASSGYVEGRFTNGYTFADQVAVALLGTPTQRTFPWGFQLPFWGQLWVDRPSGNALNFAYGGAEITQGYTPVPSLRKQVNAIKKLPGGGDPDALYIVTFGGNDVRDLVPAEGRITTGWDALGDIYENASVLRREVERLIDWGAGHVVVTGVTDIGLLPEFTGEPDEGYRRGLASSYSRLLDDLAGSMLSTIALEPWQELSFISLFDLSQEIAFNPGAFGLTDVSQACLEVKMPAPDVDCSGFLFFDELHPTAHAHGILADRILGLLDSPELAASFATAGFASLATVEAAQVPAPAALSLFGLGAVAVAVRRRCAA